MNIIINVEKCVTSYRTNLKFEKRLFFVVLFYYKTTSLFLSPSNPLLFFLIYPDVYYATAFLFRPASFQLLKHCLIQNPVGFPMIFYDNPLILLCWWLCELSNMHRCNLTRLLLVFVLFPRLLIVWMLGFS